MLWVLRWWLLVFDGMRWGAALGVNSPKRSKLKISLIMFVIYPSKKDREHM
jgi:hypothetical protein